MQSITQNPALVDWSRKHPATKRRRARGFDLPRATENALASPLRVVRLTGRSSEAMMYPTGVLGVNQNRT